MAKYPELNYCPQCGEALQDREAHGRPRRYCPSCNRVIFHDPKVAAGAVVEQAGRVLLVQQSHGPKKDRWSIPAGFVEHDEPPALAAIRECREETGLEIELTGLLGIMSGGELPGEASFLIVYRGQITGGRLKPGDDAQRAAFFHRDRLPPLAYAPTRKALERWRKRQFP